MTRICTLTKLSYRKRDTEKASFCQYLSTRKSTDKKGVVFYLVQVAYAGGDGEGVPLPPRNGGAKQMHVLPLPENEMATVQRGEPNLHDGFVPAHLPDAEFVVPPLNSEMRQEERRLDEMRCDETRCDAMK